MSEQIDNLLEVSNLSVRFPVRRKSIFEPRRWLYAVDDISFTIARGHTLGLVGESGSGKTTAALAAARLVQAHSGSVRLRGQEILSAEGDALARVRNQLQFIFQDPYSSLNPRWRAERIVREPMRSQETLSPEDQLTRVDELFEEVGLRQEQKRLFPHQFSGGQRQRIGIARALSTHPELIICDEPVSALDVAVQAQILNLLTKLQQDLSLTYLFISHDLGVVQHMCDEIAVMYMGKIVEYADRKSLFSNPLHPYTKALISAVPTIDTEQRKKNKRILIPGDPPDPVSPPSGCRFASRCPVAEQRCHETPPALRTVAGATRNVACHLVTEDGRSPL